MKRSILKLNSIRKSLAYLSFGVLIIFIIEGAILESFAKQSDYSARPLSVGEFFNMILPPEKFGNQEVLSYEEGLDKHTYKIKLPDNCFVYTDSDEGNEAHSIINAWAPHLGSHPYPNSVVLHFGFENNNFTKEAFLKGIEEDPNVKATLLGVYGTHKNVYDVYRIEAKGKRALTIQFMLREWHNKKENKNITEYWDPSLWLDFPPTTQGFLKLANDEGEEVIQVGDDKSKAGKKK